MNQKTAVILFGIVFSVVFGMGFFYFSSASQEPIIVEFNKDWPVGSDIEVGMSGGKIIPLLVFEHKGDNYSTTGSGGLPADLKNAVPLEEMIKSAKDDLSAKTFQKFFIGGNDGNNYVCVMYVLLKDKDVYYTTEQIYSKEFCILSLEEQEGKTAIHHYSDTGVFCVVWGVLSLIISLGISCLLLLLISRKKEVRGSGN